MKEFKCKKCGKCCKILYVIAKKPNKDVELWLKYHNIVYENNRFIIPVVCKYQSKNGLCLIHTRKPDYCKRVNCEMFK